MSTEGQHPVTVHSHTRWDPRTGKRITVGSYTQRRRRNAGTAGSAQPPQASPWASLTTWMNQRKRNRVRALLERDYLTEGNEDAIERALDDYVEARRSDPEIRDLVVEDAWLMGRDAPGADEPVRHNANHVGTRGTVEGPGDFDVSADPHGLARPLTVIELQQRRGMFQELDPDSADRTVPTPAYQAIRDKLVGETTPSQQAATRRFFDLRASGYTGWIDQDGNKVEDMDAWTEQRQAEQRQRWSEGHTSPEEYAALAEREERAGSGTGPDGSHGGISATLSDPTYCKQHDIFNCPYAHDPRTYNPSPGFLDSRNPGRTEGERLERGHSLERCSCVCNSGGYCGGCGHVGCGGRR